MAFYYYEAKNLKGEKTSGFLETKNKRELVWQLKKDGFVPTMIELREKKEGRSKPFNFSIFRGISLVDKLMFTRHLAVMVKGGISLPEAIEVLADQVKSSYFQDVLKEVAKSVRKGVPLCEALENYPNVFSLIYINMVRVGETLGKLEEALKLLATQIKKEHALKSKIKGAMVYPGVVLSATFAIGILMMIVVIPKITKIFSELEIELPVATRMIIFISDFLRNHFFLFLGGAVLIVIALRFFLKSSPGKKMISWLFLKIPLVKVVTIKVNSASFCRTLSSMLDGGVPVVKALKIISLAVSNIYYSQAIKEASEEVKKGISLNAVLKEKPDIFPPLVIQMMKVGEGTGMSVRILKQLADFYEQEVDGLTKNMASIVEPVLMIIIGSAVGFFAISMLQPMYSIMDNIE